MEVAADKRVDVIITNEHAVHCKEITNRSTKQTISTSGIVDAKGEAEAMAKDCSLTPGDIAKRVGTALAEKYSDSTLLLPQSDKIKGIVKTYRYEISGGDINQAIMADSLRLVGGRPFLRFNNTICPPKQEGKYERMKE